MDFGFPQKMRVFSRRTWTMSCAFTGGEDTQPSDGSESNEK